MRKFVAQIQWNLERILLRNGFELARLKVLVLVESEGFSNEESLKFNYTFEELFVVLFQNRNMLILEQQIFFLEWIVFSKI